MIGVDLGTTNVRIHVKGKGVLPFAELRSFQSAADLHDADVAIVLDFGRHGRVWIEGFAGSDKTFRLSGRGEDGSPPTAGRVQPLDLCGEQLDRHMNKAFMQEPDHKAGLAGHGGVDRVAREKVAE